MRLRVAYAVEVTDDFRMALRHSWGECGTLASRDEVKDHMRLVGSSTDEDLMQEWQDCPECHPTVCGESFMGGAECVLPSGHDGGHRSGE